MSMPKRPGFTQERDGPGLTFILVALVVVAVLGAKYFNFAPGKKTEPADQSQRVAATAPLVVVYTAHPSENYTPNAAHAKGAGDVVTLMQTLQNELQHQGLRTHLVSDIEVVPWNQAFTAARNAVLPVANQSSGVSAILDLHRDALEGKPDGYTTVYAEQKPIAKILLIVGDVENPYIEQNLAFAEALRAELEVLAPGICRGVKILHEQINGDLHPQSVQVFIGDYSDNTVEEAKAAVSYLARAAANVLKR